MLLLLSFRCAVLLLQLLVLLLQLLLGASTLEMLLPEKEVACWNAERGVVDPPALHAEPKAAAPLPAELRKAEPRKAAAKLQKARAKKKAGSQATAAALKLLKARPLCCNWLLLALLSLP